MSSTVIIGIAVVFVIILLVLIFYPKSNGGPGYQSYRTMSQKQQKAARDARMKRRQVKKTKLMQSRDSCVSRGARDFVQPNSAADVSYILRPPDEPHFNKVNPDKFYGSKNMVPHPNAGYQMTNCSYKNLTVTDKKDPILDVAMLLPSEAKSSKFIEHSDLTNFPVGSSFPSLARSAYMNCIQADRHKISESNGLKRRVGSSDLLRPWDQSYQARVAQVIAQSKSADAPNTAMMFAGASDLYSAIDLASSVPSQSV